MTRLLSRPRVEASQRLSSYGVRLSQCSSSWSSWWALSAASVQVCVCVGRWSNKPRPAIMLRTGTQTMEEAHAETCAVLTQSQCTYVRWRQMPRTVPHRATQLGCGRGDCIHPCSMQEEAWAATPWQVRQTTQCNRWRQEAQPQLYVFGVPCRTVRSTVGVPEIVDGKVGFESTPVRVSAPHCGLDHPQRGRAANVTLRVLNFDIHS